MSVQSDIARNAVDGVIDAYESRLSTVVESMRRTVVILAGIRQEQREQIENLKDLLARSESLRKKDFEALVAPLIQGQSEHQARIEQAIAELEAHGRTMVAQLRGALSGALPVSWEALQREILEQQRLKERGVSVRIREFHIEQRSIERMLQNLVSKGPRVRIRDLKLSLKALGRPESELARSLEETEQLREDVHEQWREIIPSRLLTD